MKKAITLLSFIFTIIATSQNGKINQLNKENQKTGFWKLISEDKNIEITTEFLNGSYVSDTKYYKNKKLVATYNNNLNDLLIIKDSTTTKAKFLINEDTRTLISPEGNEIDETISNYFYSFSEFEPLFEEGIEKFYVFIARKLDFGNFTGKIKIKFDVNPNGIVDNISLIESNLPKLESEAKKVVSKSPRWQPGHKAGEFITTAIIYPITLN